MNTFLYGLATFVSITSEYFNLNANKYIIKLSGNEELEEQHYQNFITKMGIISKAHQLIDTDK